MLSPEEIAEQQLLAAHRRTLAIYLKQQAMIGASTIPTSRSIHMTKLSNLDNASGY
jgi:hypothetical protein